MNKRLINGLFLGIMFFLLFQGVHAQDISALKGKKILYVYGGWDGHEPKQCSDIFVPWLESAGAEVFLFDKMSCYKDTVLMQKIDLIIQAWTQGNIGQEEEKGLLEAVKRGVGIAGWHGGTGDSFRDNVEFQFMIGGQWVAHPGGVFHTKSISETKTTL